MTFPVVCSDCGASVGEPCVDGCPAQDPGRYDEEVNEEKLQAWYFAQEWRHHVVGDEL